MKYFEDLNFDPTQKLGQKIILRWLLNKNHCPYQNHPEIKCSKNKA